MVINTEKKPKGVGIPTAMCHYGTLNAPMSCLIENDLSSLALIATATNPPVQFNQFN